MERLALCHNVPNLEALDQLGMSIALWRLFERGLTCAQRWWSRIRCFRVQPVSARRGRPTSTFFEHDLILHGVSTEWPGFDILALDSSVLLSTG